jgi:hypothetical protein
MCQASGSHEAWHAVAVASDMRFFYLLSLGSGRRRINSLAREPALRGLCDTPAKVFGGP